MPPETHDRQREQTGAIYREASSSKRIVFLPLPNQLRSDTWDSIVHAQTINKRREKIIYNKLKKIHKNTQMLVEKYLRDREIRRRAREAGDVNGGVANQGIEVELVSRLDLAH